MPGKKHLIMYTRQGPGSMGFLPPFARDILLLLADYALKRTA
jgi:hypothetical protein